MKYREISFLQCSCSVVNFVAVDLYLHLLNIKASELYKITKTCGKYVYTKLGNMFLLLLCNKIHLLSLFLGYAVRTLRMIVSGSVKVLFSSPEA
jgi:hypothetical protein